MDLDDAAAVIASALKSGAEFEDVALGRDGSVTLPVQHSAAVVSEHRAGVQRISAGLRMAAVRLRPAGEPVSLTRQELLLWFEGRDGLEEATSRCDQCLEQLGLHPTAEAWVCPSCGTVTLT